jgi:tetratricopeptide (TPR) repeat protein
MKTTFTSLIALSAVALSLAQANAADTSSFAPAKPAAAAAADKLAGARAHIAAKEWPAAIDALKRINDTASADWNNLMGYSLRKGKTPDLEAAQRHYDEALRIDPAHRNALEYSGELALMKGDLAAAEARLARLATVCAGACEQQAELKTAIDKFKAAGNKFVSASW